MNTVLFYDDYTLTANNDKAETFQALRALLIKIQLFMQVMPCRLENRFTNMFPTIMGRLHRMDRFHVMGGYFGGFRLVGQPRSRREDAVWRDDVDLFQIRDWQTAAGTENVGVRRSERPRPENGPDHQQRGKKKESFFPSVTIILFVKF